MDEISRYASRRGTIVDGNSSKWQEDLDND